MMFLYLMPKLYVDLLTRVLQVQQKYQNVRIAVETPETETPGKKD